jgi:hypothetical protein
MNQHGQWYDRAQQEIVRASVDLEVTTAGFPPPQPDAATAKNATTTDQPAEADPQTEASGPYPGSKSRSGSDDPRGWAVAARFG